MKLITLAFSTIIVSAVAAEGGEKDKIVDALTNKPAGSDVATGAAAGTVAGSVAGSNVAGGAASGNIAGSVAGSAPGGTFAGSSAGDTFALSSAGDNVAAGAAGSGVVGNSLGGLPKNNPIVIGDNQVVKLGDGQNYQPGEAQKDGKKIDEITYVSPVEPVKDAPAPVEPVKDAPAPVAPVSADAPVSAAAAAANSADSPQEVAFIVKSGEGADAKAIGSLALKTTGDGSSYAYIKTDGDERTFSLKDGVATAKINGKAKAVGHVEAHGGNALILAADGDAQGVIKQKLEFDGAGMVKNVKFYASASATVGISIDGVIPEGAKPIEVYKKVSSSAKLGPIGWSNGTMSTVTNYVTYCPEETTITVTTCETEVCKPHEIVVTSETTITITGECLVEATPAAAAGNARPHNNDKGNNGNNGNKVEPTSTSRAAAAISASSFNGVGAKNFAGVAGIAGVIAMLV